MEATNTKIFSIDCGNGDVKTNTAVIDFKYPSGYTVLDLEPEDDADVPVIGFNGKWYAFDEKRGVDSNKCQDERMFIMSIPAICQNLIDSGADLTRIQTVSLAIGQTIELFDKDRVAFADYYKRYAAEPVTVSYKGYNIRFKVRQDEEGVFVLPQSEAIYTAHSADLKAVYDFITLIEIGSQTTDFTVVESGKMNKHKCFSIDLGTNELFCRINRRQKKLTREDISEEIVKTYLVKGRLNYGDSEVREFVKNVIMEEVDSFTKDILREMKRHKINVQVPVVLCGGGSVLLWKYLKDMFIMAEDDNGDPIRYDEYENARCFKRCALIMRRIIRKRKAGAA